MIAVDSNIMLYALNDGDGRKYDISLDLILLKPVVSLQCLTETLNVCRKRWKYDKNKLLTVLAFFLKNTQFASTDLSSIELAAELVKRYDFQLFDSIIVAAALDAHCSVLYSEDMQHELLVNEQLRIINPFLKKLVPQRAGLRGGSIRPRGLQLCSSYIRNSKAKT